MPWRHREPLDPAPSLAILPHPPLQPLPILFPVSNYTQETPPSSHPGSQILTVNTSPSSFSSNNIFPIFYIILTIPSYPDTYFTGILGGGFLLGSLVMVMEDAEAPHHLLLLRNFMAQGLVHQQPLLFASPSEEPRAFLGTLPAPVGDRKEERRRVPDPDREGNEQGLRIAWQYKKYFGEQPVSQSHSRDVKQECSNIFDLRKSIERHLLSSQNIECMSFEKISDLGPLRERCSSFLSKLQWDNSSIGLAGRIAIQSLCAPQCGFSDWDMVSFVRSLRAMLRSSRAVAIITFPSSILPHSFSKRWQHLADTLLSVKAIPDDDKDLAKLLTGYQDMVGLLHVHKVARIGSQVPVILEAKTFSLKLRGRRSLILEKLNQAPVEGSSGTSYGTSGSCTASFKGSSIDF